MTQTPSIEEIQNLGASELLAYIKRWGAERRVTDPVHSSAKAQGLKLMSELGELADNLAKGKDVKDDIGDCVVVLVMIAALEGHSITDCLRVAYADIKDRKGIMYEGVFIKESDPRYLELLNEAASTVASAQIQVQESFLDPVPETSAYTSFLEARAASTSASVLTGYDGFKKLMQAQWGENAARRAQTLGCDLAMQLARKSTEVWETGRAITDGYYTMYNKLLSVGGDDEELMRSCYYLLRQEYDDLAYSEALEVVKNGLK